MKTRAYPPLKLAFERLTLTGGSVTGDMGAELPPPQDMQIAEERRSTTILWSTLTGKELHIYRIAGSASHRSLSPFVENPLSGRLALLVSAGHAIMCLTWRKGLKANNIHGAQGPLPPLVAVLSPTGTARVIVLSWRHW